MTRNETRREYFRYICDKAGVPGNFGLVAHRLAEIPFRYSVESDGNREADGIGLRYRFGEECGYEDYLIAEYLDREECSVLEMMTALCVRCEESIMDGAVVSEQGEPFAWFLFGVMLDSLGLSDMNDANFDIDIVDEAIRRFLDREYSPDGEGGLFRLKYPERDLRGVEIWYQMCWFLDEILGEEM